MPLVIKKRVKVEVPVRADIAGAASDIASYLEKYHIDFGAVTNISLPVRSKIEVSFDYSSKKIKIAMPDLEEKIEGGIEELEKQEENNACQVIKHFLRFFSLNHEGLNVVISSSGKIPPASGLGTSSAIEVGLVLALAKLYGVYGINPCEFSYLVETSMGVCGGKQDYYSAWIEGLNLFYFEGPGKGLVNLKGSFDKNSSYYKWFQERMVVYFTGKSRSSSKMNEQMEGYIKKNPKIFSDLAKNAKRSWQMILNKNSRGVAKCINLDRKQRLKLSELYYNDDMWQMAAIAEKLGYAHRGCGAGGGGCLLFFGEPKKKKELIKNLSKIGGYLVY